MNIFTSIVQGDSTAWLDGPIKLSDGRQADAVSGWTLKYSLRGPAALDITAVASGTSWASTVTATQGASLTPGAYFWSAAISNGSERITVGNGEILVKPDLSAVSGGFDGRSTAQKALQDCEAAMASFNATGGKVKKYEIAGRTMEFQTIGDLMTLHSFWKAKVMAEGTAASIANGQGNPRNLYVRFGRTT